MRTRKWEAPYGAVIELNPGGEKWKCTNLQISNGTYITDKRQLEAIAVAILDALACEKYYHAYEKFSK